MTSLDDKNPLQRISSRMPVTVIRIVAGLIMSLALGCDGNPATPAADTPEVASGPLGPIVPQPDVFSTTVTVNAGELHQTMQGFGSSMRIFSDPHLIGQNGTIDNSLQLSSPDEEAVLDSVYKTIGLTRVRPIIQSNGAQTDAAAAPRRDWVFGDGHIDLVKRARARGLNEWWLSPIKLEPWMSDATVGQYADWAMAEIRYWKSQGVELTWYSVANEPRLQGLSGIFLRDAVKLIGPRLAAEGIKTKLVIPDEVEPANALAEATLILADPQARKYVSAIATHLYGNELSTMSGLSALAAQYDLPLWMSEFAVVGHSPIAWGNVVHRMVADYNVSAVDYMWGFFGDHDLAQLVAIHQDGRQFTGAKITPAGYAMAQYARYVLPGARRVDASSSDTTVLASAFMRNGKMTIVVINEDDSPQAVQFTVRGATSLQNLKLVRTSDLENLAFVGVIAANNGGFGIDLPPRSISTIFQ